ncbi:MULTISPECIES: hypothetical protein [unclassified Mycobacterium]|uniref:DoxX family protein n=1 Tax=unclassified Mycobacterium TaxID=2642494 RepID=UPI0009922CA8|nr:MULTISPECIES: hypothetical protein [unclassified Mycobacterium]
MAPLVALVVGTLLARLIGAQGFTPVNSWPAAVVVGLAAMFTLTGVAHFVPKMRQAMIAIVPPWIPAAGLLVALTGVLELLGAIGVLVPSTRVVAAGCLGVLLVVMFPANVYAATQRSNPLSTPLGWRTAEQLLFLAASAIVVWG